MRPARILLIVSACLFALAALGFSAYFLHEPPPAATAEPFFEGLGPHTRKVTTRSPVAQRYFDQGLAFFYGFNNDEAIRSFEAAAASDPACAMAYWGVAAASTEYLLNPSIVPARVQAALSALATARRLEPGAAAVERGLIEALAGRYPDPLTPDREALDREYYTAMRRLWKAFPDDADVGALTAQALMFTQHEGQWAPNGGPLPDTETLMDLLHRVLAKSPKHPFASHLLIHVVESSSHPEWGDAAADLLRDYAPGLGHLTHMPTHIDIRRGRWQPAVIASEKAIAADAVYRKTVEPAGFYWLLMVHNNHMLAYAAAMQGESKKATDTIREMISVYLTEALRSQYPAMVDGFLAMPYELHLRFGRWDAMLAEPPPRSDVFPIATALWHFGRGVAYAAKNQVSEAKAEQAAFLVAKQVPADGSTFRYTPANQLLDVAENMLAGEILYREGKLDLSIAALKRAVQKEDALPYSEPPDWFQPVRHALAAVLMNAGRFDQAEAVCREDLVRHPENGWSLFGLSQSLRKQKKNAEADAVTARFKHVWQHADFKLTAPCLCLPAKE